MPKLEDREVWTLDLKYCEMCGALCLRRHDSAVPYCERCARVLSELAPAAAVGGAPGRRP